MVSDDMLHELFCKVKQPSACESAQISVDGYSTQHWRTCGLKKKAFRGSYVFHIYQKTFLGLSKDTFIVLGLKLNPKLKYNKTPTPFLTLCEPLLPSKAVLGLCPPSLLSHPSCLGRGQRAVLLSCASHGTEHLPSRKSHYRSGAKLRKVVT